MWGTTFRAVSRESLRVTGGMEVVGGKEGRSRDQRPSLGALRPARKVLECPSPCVSSNV
jgi:hypothetical protein